MHGLEYARELPSKQAQIDQFIFAQLLCGVAGYVVKPAAVATKKSDVGAPCSTRGFDASVDETSDTPTHRARIWTRQSM
jgi:hypothetical protein